MSKWGIFQDPQDDTVHVLPVDDEGYALNLHHLGPTECPCGTRTDGEVVVHRDPERRWYDS